MQEFMDNYKKELLYADFNKIFDKLDDRDCEFLSINNPTLPIQIIQENIDRPWDWSIISSNIKITLPFIRDHPNLPWNYVSLSYRTDITIEFVKNNLDKPWKWDILSKNPNITWNIIQENLELPWNWRDVSNKLLSHNYSEKDEEIIQKYKETMVSIDQ